MFRTCFSLLFIFGCSLLQAQTNYLKTVRISDSIYAFVPSTQLNDIVDGNSLAIIGPSGIFVVDTYNKAYFAKEMIAKLKKITRLPVRFILNTHWHYDHVMGNKVFKDNYPGATIITHEQTKIDLDNYVAKEAAAISTGYAPIIKEMREELATGKKTGGDTLTVYEKTRWKQTIEDIEKQVADSNDLKYIPPDVTFNDSLTLYFGNEKLQIFHTPVAHSKGDAMLWIPSKRLLLTGDIIVNPIPYAFGTNHPNWKKILDTIVQLNPSIIVPGHGEVEYDLGYVKQLTGLLNAFDAKLKPLLEQGLSLEDIQKQFEMEDYRKIFAGNDPAKNWAFKNYFINPALKKNYNVYKERQQP